MKATSLSLAAAALVTVTGAALATAACANEARSDEVGAPASTQDTISGTYLDAPQTPGTWRYEDEPGEKLALYGEDPRAPVFLMRCGDGAVALARVSDTAQDAPRTMTVTTETVTGQLEASPVPGREVILAARLAPGDPLLDAMAITKGRFAIEVEGMAPLYLPAWVEVSRVIEDCR